jgi:hypothetical protein
MDVDNIKDEMETERTKYGRHHWNKCDGLKMERKESQETQTRRLFFTVGNF